MFDQRLRKTCILLLLALATAAPATADGPRTGFKLDRDAIFTSPDHQVRVEQYSKPTKTAVSFTNSGPSTGFIGMLFC